MRFRNITWALFAILLTSCQSSQHNAPSANSFVSKSQLTPVKGLNDPAEYRYLQLDNGLKVLLLSDPDMTLSYASLSVSAGYFDDPTDIPGLAHLYEHMMSKGSTKYPKAAEYKQYLADHGGASNAATHVQMTNYYLKVSKQYFAQALDRFAWQFIDPLLPKELIYKETHAVQAEYLLKYKDRFRRKREVLRTLINPAHPYRKFSTGNLDTLADQENITLVQALREFGEQHYCPRDMTAVLAGSQSLNELALLAKSHLLAIDHRCKKQVQTLAPPFVQPIENTVVNIKSLTSSKYLTLAFHVENSDVLRAGMMDKYIEWLLETYNPEGLESKLKQSGYIKSLAVNNTEIDKQNQLINIAFTLTKQGQSEKPYIIASTLKYLALLAHEEQATYAQFAQLQQQKFDLSLNHKSKREIRDIPHTLLMAPPEKVLTFRKVAEYPGEESVRTWLLSLNKQHMFIINEDKNLEPANLEPIYKTRFDVEQAPTPDALSPLPDFQLPTESKYAQFGSADAQHLYPLSATNKLTMYYVPQQVQNDPYTAVTLYIDTNTQAANFEPLNKLFELRMQKAMRQITEEAKSGNVNVLFDTTDSGIKVHIRGLRANWAQLISDILNKFTQAEQWNVSSKVTMKTLKRHFTEYPGIRLRTLADRELSVQLGAKTSAQEFTQFADSFTEQQYQQFVAQYWQKSQIQVVIFGDITIPQIAETESRIADFAEQMITAPPSEQGFSIGETRLTTVLHNGSDDAINLVQIPQQQDALADAQVYLTAAILKAPFFHQLRTLEQLGYSVKVRHAEDNALIYLNYYVQSPVADSTALLRRVEQFTQWAVTKVDQVDQSEFDVVRNGVINALKQKTLNSETIDSTLRYNLRNGRSDNYDQLLINEIEHIQVEKFKAFASQLLRTPLQGVVMQSTD